MYLRWAKATTVPPDGLGTGPIVGIAISAVAVVVIVVGISVWCWRHRTSRPVEERETSFKKDGGYVNNEYI
jgi:hypothetical protein